MQKPEWWKARVELLLKAIGIVVSVGSLYLGYLGFERPASHHDVISGFVREAGGPPIVGATITISEDRGIPEVLHSDSNGIFLIEIKSDTQAMKLHVAADGYRPFDEDANAKTSQPLDVILVKTVLAKTPISNPSLEHTLQNHADSFANGPGSIVINGNGNRVTTRMSGGTR